MDNFLLFLWKKRKFLLINFVVIFILSAVNAFVLSKKEYRAEVSFLPPADGSSSALSLMGIPVQSLSVGGSVLNDQVGAIFGSKQIKRQIIEKFNFYDFFKLAKNQAKFERAQKMLNQYVMFEASEKGSMGFEKIIMYTITCFHPSPDSAKMLCDYAYSLLDSSIKSISICRAHRNRLFVEDQLALHKRSLDSLQKGFEEFQVAHKAFVVPEQMRLSLKNYAEIKSAAIVNDLKMQGLKKEFKGELPELEELGKNAAVYNQQLSNIESNASSDVLPSLGLSAKLLPQYTNLMRGIEVEEQVILLFSKELEQARIQESKNISQLVVIDPPYVPTYKARPKRILVMGLFLVIEHLFLFLLFGYQYYYSNVLMKNEKVRSLVRAMKNS